MKSMGLQFVLWRYVALALFLTYVASVYIRRYVKWKSVERLGGESPRVKTRFIFGQWSTRWMNDHN